MNCQAMETMNNPLTLDRRIYVGNLSKFTTTNDLYHCFSKYGNIEAASILHNSFGFVLFFEADGANGALEENGNMLCNREMIVRKAMMKRKPAPCSYGIRVPFDCVAIVVLHGVSDDLIGKLEDAYKVHGFSPYIMYVRVGGNTLETINTLMHDGWMYVVVPTSVDSFSVYTRFDNFGLFSHLDLPTSVSIIRSIYSTMVARTGKPR